MSISANLISDVPYDFMCPHCQAVLFRLWHDRKIEYFNCSWTVGSFALTQVEELLKACLGLPNNFSLMLRIGKQPCCYRSFYFLEALMTDNGFDSEDQKEFLFNKLITNISETNFIIEGNPLRPHSANSISRQWQMSVINTSYGRVYRHRFGLYVYDDSNGKTFYECLFRAQSNFLFWLPELHNLALGISQDAGFSTQIFDSSEIMEIGGVIN